ncbi:hypothetical protein EJ110_NYTH53965 [Nymphaea thermarum]|nr:hypothetical protein EJ110_NYTH53965 [Nymphaea thermarum]
MTKEIAPKSDVAFDAGIAPKSENLPVQVTHIRLTKDNYLSWSAALEIGITSRGRLPYITGDKPAPSKTDPQWANWALEDSQVKVWIISSVSADIQPLILRKPTSFEMWNVLARMYGRKKRVLRTYQIKRSTYTLKQGDLSVASFYAALKTKWEELDYHVNDNWDCGSDHPRYWEKEWMDRTFLFLGGLRDEFESIRSQILNCDEILEIEDVYARVESEEQRRQVMQIDSSRGSGPSAFVSRSSVPGQRPVRRCTHCHKPGLSVDFCWDLHPEKRLVRRRPPSSRRGSLVQDSNQSGFKQWRATSFVAMPAHCIKVHADDRRGVKRLDQAAEFYPPPQQLIGGKTCSNGPYILAKVLDDKQSAIHHLQQRESII